MYPKQSQSLRFSSSLLFPKARSEAYFHIIPIPDYSRSDQRNPYPPASLLLEPKTSAETPGSHNASDSLPVNAPQVPENHLPLLLKKVQSPSASCVASLPILSGDSPFHCGSAVYTRNDDRHA